MSENEGGKTREKAEELLRSGRLVFLQVAGYKQAEILSFGDLATLPSEKMIELLHSEALAAVLRKKRIRVKTFRQKKRKKAR
jgi:hypothetical protein